MGCCRDKDGIDFELKDIQISDHVIVSKLEYKENKMANNCCGFGDDAGYYSHLRDPWNQHSTPNFWSENPVPIKVKLVHPKAKVPEKAHNGDIAWDIFCVDDDMWDKKLFCEGEPCFELMPYESYSFSTGIKVATPHNYGFLLRERSGLGVSDISLGAGVIEGTYRGEWKIHIRNISKKPRMFKVGDKIAQAVLIPIIPALPEVVDELPETERGEKGFGSSGR